MGKRWFYAFILCTVVHICGCGSLIQKDTVTKEAPQVEKEVNGESEIVEDADSVIKEELWQENQHAATILEDEEFLYFCGKNNILKVDKETLETKYIWENTKNKGGNDAYAYSGSRGILTAGKIYFIEEWTEEIGMDTVSMWALSVVSTDGSNYERFESYEMNPADKEDCLLLIDGVLYYAVLQDGTMEGYSLDKDGVLLKAETISVKAENVPKDYWEPYYYENGSRILPALESEKRFGYYLLRDEDYEMCIVDPATGNKKELPSDLEGYSLAAVNNDYFLFDSYTEGKMLLVDVKTLKARELAETDAYNNVITMDSDYVYFQRLYERDDFTRYKYLRIDIETGYKEEVCTVDALKGMNATSSWYLMDITIKNNYIYYVGEHDYKLYLMRRDLNRPNTEDVIGDAFYETGISKVGRIETYKETIYSTKEPEKVIATLDLEWLVVDGRFSGADKINQILTEEQPGYKEYIHQNAQEYEEWDYFDIPGFSFSSKVSPIYYMDGRYLSFVQQNYDYAGGAHGMPFWIGHTFDLETGNELMLSGIVADDDDTLKEIVTRYFTELYNENPDEYWDGAVEIVQENTSLQSPFYLSEEGIVFYYGPYELAPYAGGFKEVVVPYTEFELKIEPGGF